MSGGIADILSLSNSFEISDLQRNQAVQMRLAEFRERADTLARQTGVVATGFFGYERENPTPREHYSAGKWIGLLFGFVIGIASANPIIFAAFCVGGFALGAIFAKEPESIRLERALNRYDAYLTSTETVAHERVRSQAMVSGGHHRTDHAQTVLADREQAAQAPTQHAV